MARSGRDELELFLDDAPAVRAAKQIQKSQEDLGRTMGQTAKTFDQTYAVAFKNIQQGSEATARKIKQDADETSAKLKSSAQGGGYGSIFAGGLAAIAAAKATQELIQFAQVAGQAYLEGDRAATSLAATTDRYNLSLVETRAQVAKLAKEYNQSQTEAEKNFAAATQAAGRVGQAGRGGDFLKAGLNLAEYGTVDKERVGTLLRQIASGSGDAFEELVQKDPTAIYEKLALSLGRTTSSLTDLEKTQALFNATLEEGDARLGAHRKHVDSAAGAWENWAATITNFQRQAGEKSVGFLQWILEGSAAGVQRLGSGQAVNDPTKEWLAEQELANQRNQAEFAARANAPAEAAAKLKAQQQQALRDIQTGLDYAEKAREARDEGPLADIRRRTKAEIDRILKANTEKGVLSGAGLAQIGFAAAFGAADEAKRILEINKQLDTQLAEMNAKYSGDQNPLTQLALSGKREMDALIETLKKLGPEFEAQSALIIEAARKVQNLNFAKGLVGSVLDISNIQARIDELTPVLTSALATGQYGQITDQFTVRESYKKETEVEKAKRILDALDQERASHDGDPDYARAARQALLAQTAGLSPEALGADPTTRDRILKELQAEKDARVEDVKEAKKLREAQLASMKKQDKAAEKATEFYDGLKNSGLTGEEIGKALKKIANMSVGVDLNVKSDREFQAAVADGSALDRVTTG